MFNDFGFLRVIPDNENPCHQDCPRRNATCHAICNDYKIYKEKCNIASKQKYSTNTKERIIISREVEHVMKMKERTNKRKKMRCPCI